MSRSSAARPLPTKARDAFEFTGGVKPVILHPDFTALEEAARILIRKHLPHGTKQELAELVGVHVNQLSRQLGGEDGLHEKVVDGAMFLFRREGMESVVTALYILRNGGSADLRERVGLLIEFGSGQLCLPGMGQ